VSSTYGEVSDAYGDRWFTESVRRLFDRYSDADRGVDATLSIKDLSRSLFSHLVDRDSKKVGTKPVILMDEYDAFMQKMGKVPPEEFDSISKILSDFIVATFKENTSLSLGVMTGVMTLSRTGILSGLNNAAVHTLFDEGSAGFFGYSEDDVGRLLEIYAPEGSDRSRMMKTVKDTYDGYVFGGKEAYNPRSLNLYLSAGRFDSPPPDYWGGVRDNSFLNALIGATPEDLQESIALLTADRGRVKKLEISQTAVYQDLYDSPTESNLCSCLVSMGYLRARPLEERSGLSPVMCEVSLPNKEFQSAYGELIEKVRSKHLARDGFLRALYSEDGERATGEFERHLARMSVRDGWDHDRCKQHLVDYLSSRLLDARAEAETGNGFADVLVEGDRDRPCVCIEVTTSDEARTKDLDAVLDCCWRKFRERGYCRDRPTCLLVAFAWDRKSCRIGIRTSGEFYREAL